MERSEIRVSVRQRNEAETALLLPISRFCLVPLSLIPDSASLHLGYNAYCRFSRGQAAPVTGRAVYSDRGLGLCVPKLPYASKIGIPRQR